MKNSNQINLIIFTVDSPRQKGSNNFGLGNVIKNVYSASKYDKKIFDGTIFDEEEKWIQIAEKAKKIVKPNSILHSHDVKANIPCFILKKQFPEIPWIHSFHYSFSTERHRNLYFCRIKNNSTYFKFNDNELENLEINAFIRADYLIFHSQFMKEDFFRRYKEYADLKTRERTTFVIPNGYNKNVFKSLPVNRDNEIKKKYGLPLKRKIILFFGRYDSNKGIDLILNLGYDRFICDNFIIVLVGNQMNNFKTVYNKWNTEIYDFPKLPQKELNEILNITNYVVLPSIYEPFGQAGLESLVVGKGVTILTKGNGFSEFVSNENIYLEDISISSIVNKVKFFEEDNVLRKKVIEENMIFAKKFQWNLIKEKYIDIYKNAYPLNINYNLLRNDIKTLVDYERCQRYHENKINEKRKEIYKTFNKKILGKILLITGNKNSRKLFDGEGYLVDAISFLTIYETENKLDTVILDEVLQIISHKRQIVRKAIKVSNSRIAILSTKSLEYLYVVPNEYNYNDDLLAAGFVLETELTFGATTGFTLLLNIYKR